MANKAFPVAVIGMAVNLPGAKSCDEFWSLLINGEDTVGEFPHERVADISHTVACFKSQLVDENRPFFTGSFFKFVDKFDAKLFQINPREALFIEPEQRIFLETAWHLLEDAGYASSIKGSNTGVYVGNTVNKYKYILTENHPSISHGNHSPFISSRVSYTHDLQGPAMMIATGCSSSLLAVHVACQGLRSGDCEMAIAGGITLDLLPVSTKTDIWNQLGITGPNVRCRAFDAAANGIAKGEGCGAVLLKPLQEAVFDGDYIYGILEATTANQDGHSNGITAPHPGAQANMLHRAWKLADISPTRLEYFEAHGTGTELGDPIEISGITNAMKMFGISGESKQKIPIGSVKANVGHLADGAAGVVALIKTLLCLLKNTIPPSVNFTKPNPHINWTAAPVYVNTSKLEWKAHSDKSPRLASVSAFGLLGTNVHAVVKEYIPYLECTPKQFPAEYCGNQVLALAANSRRSLVQYVTNLLEYFKYETATCMQLKGVCFTINTGREQARFSHRAIAHANSWKSMINALEYIIQCLIKLEVVGISVECSSVTSIGHLENACELEGGLRSIAEDFLNGKMVQWNAIYSNAHVQKVPLLPTYVFDQVRYWPKVGIPINKELLHLESEHGKAICSLSQGEALQQLIKSEDVQHQDLLSSTKVEKVIQVALNEVLNITYNWNERADENLFALGVDSLICTQLSMKIKEKLGCHFSVSEFHNNPTFFKLKDLILSKVAFMTNLHFRDTDDKLSNKQDPRLLLQVGLNEALGKEYDWMELQHDNLFMLGVDSLVFSHISLKLQECLSLGEPLTLSELHDNPTYCQLCQIIESKLCGQVTDTLNLQTRKINSFANSCDGSSFPLTFAQKRLWMMQEMIGSDSCVYNITNCLRITGNFHAGAFVLSVNTVLSSHCAFHTVFIDSPQGPKQHYNPSLTVVVEEIDLETFCDKAEETVMSLYNNDYRMSFDLRQGPLVRCKLYHLPNTTYYFTMVAHHIVFDGWSHFVFYNELWQNYTIQSEAKQALYGPPDLSIRNEIDMYTSISESAIKEELVFWMDKLSSPLPYTVLPGDKRRPPVFTHRGSRITSFINNDVVERLRRFCEDQCTMFMILVSAVNLLTYLYTGEKDMIVGTPIAGRNDLKLNHVIGCFVNTLPLRVTIEEDYDFQNFLQAVAKVCLEAYDHQSVPFEQLVSQLNLSRDTSVTPVFSINVCYHNTELRCDHIKPPNEIKVERKLLHNDSAKWDLYFDFLEEPEGMRFTLEYYSDLFSDDYAQCIVDNFLHLLEYVIENPQKPITGISLTTPNVSVDRNKGNSVLHGPCKDIGEKTLPLLLLDSLKHHAETSLIRNHDGAMYTHGELLEKSEILAVFLRKFCGLSKQSTVGLLLENSIEVLMAILACVLSGLIYVPLDPNSPKTRLEFICREADISAVIFSRLNLALANHIQWACTSAKILLCIDSKSFSELQEDTLGAPLMDTELWNSVASDARDDIEGGGWKSSFTGEYMSSEEMKEYASNVHEKLKPYLTPMSRVLEIGCASGLTTQILSPLVCHYVATDISPVMMERLQAKLTEQRISNVDIFCTPADEVGEVFRGQIFDVIVMNSVVHCFPGHNYLRKVLSMCEQLLSDTGIIFIGDILDLDLKHKLVTSLKLFKEANPEFRVKTEWHSELFLSKQFIRHICNTSTVLTKVTCSRKLYSLCNELTDFRFDAIFTKAADYDKDEDNETELQYRTYAVDDITEAVQYNDIHKMVSLLTSQIHFTDNIYILYTSGTTGVPKGVIIGHEAILNYVLWAVSAYNFDKATTVPLFSPLTFDFTLTSIYPPLLCGSTIHIFKNFQDSYLSIASDKSLTLVKFSPLQLNIILSETTECLSPSTFILGGEELTLQLLEKLKLNKCCSSFVVWNEYGPTEATVGCIVKHFSGRDLPLAESQLCSIGKPIDNVSIAVVRDNFKPLPVGGRGVLCIGGKCLYSDFAGTKTLIRQTPLKAACWGSPGDQMLITDDIVAVIPTTFDLAYFGREKDCNTIKVNGVRIDMLETQLAIEGCPLVQSAWVCSFNFEDHTHLGAALKLHPSKNSHENTWKQHLVSYLSQTLPLRLMPKILVAVTDPPINSNGKKDTPLLRRLCMAEVQAASKNKITQETSVHRSNVTIKLQKIWQSILPISHLPDPDEDFFLDLSGDSLQAIHLVRKMRDEGFVICVTDIFRNPSINKLKPILESNTLHTGTELDRSADTEAEYNQSFKPTPIIEEYLTRSPPLRFPDQYSLPALLEFHCELEVRILRKVLRAVIEKHASLRSKFECNDGKIEQHSRSLYPDEPYITSTDITSECDDLYAEPQFLNICSQLERKHSLSDGTLLNACIINYYESSSAESTKQIYVLIMVHHMAIDIVSWQQVLEDIAAAFRQTDVLNDCTRELSLPKCILPFSAFCESLHAEAINGIFVKEIPYWKSIEVKAAKSCSLVKSNQQGCFRFAQWLNKSINATILRSTSTALACSDEHILLTALGRCFSSIHGHNQTTVCLESHGRQLSTVDSTDTVGWCTSKFPYVLDCPLMEDIFDQVKIISEDLSNVPNHGLGFSVLKSAGKLTMKHSNIMVVFQGSLDASTKETFDGGTYNFDSIPWIEVMLSELNKGHFHRHPEEVLEFDIEVIAWIHGGELKVGCLYNAEVVSKQLIENIINGVDMIIKALAKKIAERIDVTLNVIPCFNITPDCKKRVESALFYHNVSVRELCVHPSEQGLLSLYSLEAKDTTDVIIIIVQLKTEEQAAEFSKIYYATKALRKCSKVVVISVGSLKGPSTKPVQIEDSVLELSEFMSEPCFYDSHSDVEYNMPFTQDGYTHLGLTIARAVRGILIQPRYKVIAVDADYTLWHGECAEGKVIFSEANIILHKFLHKMKGQGMLLVILSKNQRHDVENIFMLHKEDMLLKNDDFVAAVVNWKKKTDNINNVAQLLNLSLDAFVFIDDSPLECEEMIKSHPEVLTLQFPQSKELVLPLLSNLWVLDNFNKTGESTNRTKMYRDEFIRQEKMQKIELLDDPSYKTKLIELLSSWNMNLTICKASLLEVRQNKKLYTRAAELLFRTNQFKMNDIYTKLENFQDKDMCWMVFLKDCHGSYGIISIAILTESSHESLTLSQWVVSCRALGREVEYRILSDIYKEKSTLYIAINETGRNIPALNFLRLIDCDITSCGKNLVYVALKSKRKLVNKSIHSVTIANDLEEFENSITNNKDESIQGNAIAIQNTTFLWELYQWIKQEWSPSQKQQGTYHSIFPIIPQCHCTYQSWEPIDGIIADQSLQTLSSDSVSTIEHCLKCIWMEILHLCKEPEDDDNFLNSGGNSFGAVFLVSKLKRMCNVEVNLMHLLQNPTYGNFRNTVLKASKIAQEQCKVQGNDSNISAAQLRMVIMQQTAPCSTAYVETVACITESTALSTSEIFQTLVKMHPILTSRIEMTDDTTNYVITTNDALDFEPPLEVIRDLNAVEIHLANSVPVMTILEAPLVKFRHVKTEDAIILVVHIHHVICDETTLLNISRTLECMMSNLLFDHDNRNLYSDYVQQEKQYLATFQYTSDDYFWKECFKDLPPEVNLSTLSPAHAVWNDSHVYVAKSCMHAIPANTVEGISAFCITVGITQFHYYLACTLLVLHSYLGVDDITLAIPVTIRNDLHQDTDGLFVNTLLFRMVIDLSLTFIEYTKAVAKHWIKALCHSQYPLDYVVRNVRKQHGKSSTSFCCVMFNYSERKWRESEIRVYSKHAKMPLCVDVFKETCELRTEWATELVNDGIAARLADSTSMMYSKGLEVTNIKISDLNVLSQSELTTLQSFNPKPIKLELQSILKAFEDHVVTHPDSTAIVFSETVLTYSHLNELASRIANGLCSVIRRNDFVDKPVIIVMKKDEYTVASILAVWKVGGHFLPVTSRDANASLKDILGQVTPVAILTNVELNIDRTLVGSKETLPVLRVEDLTTYSSTQQSAHEIINHHLAYIIRTSGSTGRPKQCKVSHNSLNIIANAWQQRYRMNEFDVNVLQWAPLSFDVFVGDIVRGLICAPGQLTICPENYRLDVSHIIGLIKNHGITISEVTPQFGMHIIENAKSGDLDSLKLFILGSDVLQSHIYNRIKKKMIKQRVINSYGMTEATIDSSFFEGATLPITRSGTVPIGKPLPGVCMHILNPSTLQPCPVGTVGELYICGSTLASGDVDIVDLKHEEGIGLKTGDAACWLPSGDIELIGRLNDMVKLRGFRISTTEIENKIVDLIADIKDACIIPMTNTDGIEFLCAFVTVKENVDARTFTRDTICSLLRGELPHYMLPDLVQVIDEIPLTSHGKVNHKGLPSISQLLESQVMFNEDSNDRSNDPAVIASLKALFAEAMGMSHSNSILSECTFMELGAHSLILIQFATLIKQKGRYNVEISDLFSYPTISLLADYIITKDTSQSYEFSDIKRYNTDENGKQDLAITGVGLRLPGGIMSLPELWEILERGNEIDLIEDFPPVRAADVLGCLPHSTANTLLNNTFQGAFLKQIDKFDSHFFKIAPGEAKYMSPEQRLFLQVATEALTESRRLSHLKGANIGVFVGSSEIGYSQLNHPDEATCISGLLPGMIATRVAYQWDLKGPTMLVDTACSSSLVALKLASESIRRKECDGALVGGVSLVLYPARTGVHGQSSILSPDFHCKALDKEANGTAVGEGVFCLYVEPITTALQEDKPIYAIIKGIATNSVGHGNGITAPTSSSQQKVIQKALIAAGVKPTDITYVEAHGTGTKLGDKIELSALASVFKDRQTDMLQIGSAKSNFGHLDSAAGLLGVFKVLASLMYGKIPPTAHFKTPHPEIADSTLCVSAKTVPWEVNQSKLRIAGVSSFGLTGTNCHAVIGEFHTNYVNEQHLSSNSYPLLLCGKSMDHIQKQISLYKTYIQQLIQNGAESGDILPRLCLSVAQRLNKLAEMKAGHTQWRIIITAFDTKQVLKLFSIVNSIKDINALIHLVKLRSDIQMQSPEHIQVLCSSNSINNAVRKFLVDAEINIEELFDGYHDRIKPTTGITLAMFSESRHWLDYTSREITSSERLIDIFERKLYETREAVRSLELSPSQEIRELQGKFCCAIIISYFLSTDLAQYLKQNQEISHKLAFTLSGMIPKYNKLFLVMIRELQENNLAIITNGIESIVKFQCQQCLNADPEAICKYAAEKYPAWADCFKFPLYCSKHLPNVLQGRMSPLSVIYPKGDLNFMYQFDKLGDLLGDVYYNMYMQLIASYAFNLSNQGRKVRLLEVGAGVGHVTRQLLPKLKDAPNLEYWFTDLGKAFVEHAKTLFADYLSMMRFCVFDITKSAPMQGLLGSFDIIVSYNVIHTTESIMKSVLNLKSCLGEDGTLFIIESAKNETWATLAWGILDGWWFFKDYDLRPEEPMIEPNKWESVLVSAGFSTVRSCPINEIERSHVEKFLFICSTKQLTSKSNTPYAGWWETDTHKFDPIKNSDAIKDESDFETSVNIETMHRDAVYDELRRIWIELLGTDNIKPDDDFNSLGGESLLAIQMINLVCKRIGYQLEIADTFGYPTLLALANYIAEQMDDVKIKSTLDGSDEVNKSDCEDSNSSAGIMVIFPGQGAQKVGMCTTMKDSPEAKLIFSRAKQVLGYDILDICTKDNSELQERLKSTEFVQVSLFVGSIAKLEQLKKERSAHWWNQVTHVAGLSVGEFAALVATDTINFEDALRVVQQRGQVMEKVVEKSNTAMVSVFGPSCEQLHDFLRSKFPRLEVSTYLADNQHTVAGNNEDCDALISTLLSAEYKELMNVVDVRKLRVAGAFHSSYVKQAADSVDPIIKTLNFSKPSVTLIMNVNGKATEDTEEIKALLCKQLVAPVHWKQSILTAYESGVRNFIEIAPGRVLSSIVKSRIAECRNCAVEFVAF